MNEETLFFFFKKSFKKHPWLIDESKYLFKPNYIFHDYSLSKILRQTEKIISNDIVIIAGLNFYLLTLFLFIKIFKRNIKVFQWSEEREFPSDITRKIIRKLFIPYFDGIISVSTMSKEYFQNTLKVPKNKVSMVLQAPFVNNSPFYRDPIDKSITKILYVGVLEKYKKVDFILSAFHKMWMINKNIRLTIVGAGSEEKKLIEYRDQNSLNDYVKFSGYIESRDEIDSYYRNHDIFFLASYETFGVVLMEAASFGLALLVSDQAGAHKDIVKNDFNGYSFEFNNMDDCLQKFEKVLLNVNEFKKNSIINVRKYNVHYLAVELFNHIFR